MNRPRIPGSQVAPGQRPYNSGAPTATTHSKVPLHEATAGKLYRVRDKDWAALHGEDLTWDDAHKLKEKLVGSRQSTTARVEDMDIPPPDWFLEAEAAAAADISAAPSADEQQEAEEADPELEAMRAPALAAARAAAQSAQARADARARPRIVAPPPAPPPAAPKAGKFTAPVRRPAPAPTGPRIVPRDKTVQPLVTRTAPPPRDRTVASEIVMRGQAPPSSDPLPLISPLAAAAIPDDPLDVPEGQLVDDDLSDVTSDLGGGASDSDVKRAQDQADEDRRRSGQG
jgi:hypothetical protein